MRSLAALLLLTSVAHADIRITGDGGGHLYEYKQKIDNLREKVFIDGPCNSSCTLYLILPKGQVCVTPRASFRFHSPYDERTGMPVPSEALKLLHWYPESLQIWIGRHGGLTFVPIPMSSREATQFVNACK